MKRTLPLLLIALSGCAAAPKYNYQSQTSTDPTIIFGDRFGGGSVTSPARNFNINIKDAAANKCADAALVGTTSNNWAKINPPTIEIKVPSGKPISVTGFSLLNTLAGISTCVPPPLMFSPKEGGTYSIDINAFDTPCVLSIVQKLPEGKLEKVTDITTLPQCKD